MAADEHLSPRQFFRGDSGEFSPGDMFESGHAPTKGAGAADRSEHVYAATTPELASDHGKHVYQVEPTGPVEPDPELIRFLGGMPSRPELLTHWRSRDPMRVVRRMD